MNVSDAPNCVTLTGNSIGVIYDCNIFIIMQACGAFLYDPLDND